SDAVSVCFSSFIFVLLPRPPASTPFPYTTLFRSCWLVWEEPDDHPHLPHRYVAGPHHRHELGCRCRTCRTVHQRSVVGDRARGRSEEHTSELQSRENLVCRLLLEKKKEQHSEEHP